MYRAVSAAVGPLVAVGQARSWERMIALVRERPVTGVVLDTSSLPSAPAPDEGVRDLVQRFPSLATVIIARPSVDAGTLVRLGRAGITELNLVEFDDLEFGLREALARAGARSTESMVLRAMGMGLTRTGRSVVRSALKGALLGWKADELAAEVGWTRAHLSVKLRGRGLPSAGQLLLWARLLHAGRWLSEPGRSAESVSRQLEYANGSVFRRALRNYLDATPTAIRSGGGLAMVLRRFLDVCGVGDSVDGARPTMLRAISRQPPMIPIAQRT